MAVGSAAEPITATAGTAAQAGVDVRSLGARYDSTRSNITIRVYSSRATRMTVHFYREASGSSERVQYQLSKGADQVWSTTVPVATLRDTYGITGTVFYGYRAWGPNWPYDASWTPGSPAGFRADVDAAGNRFNPNKLLIDPYAREISHDPLVPGQTDGTIYASGPSYRQIDNAPRAPKSIILPGDGISIGAKPARALKDDIVYEVHLRGLTRNDPSIPAASRGTYRGAGLKARSLATQGITAVEFLPVQETQNATNDVDPSGTDGDNYWGYSTLNYFAPDRRYAADQSAGGPTREFKEMVRSFHDAGIKVLIDVVYNHTGEGGPWQSGNASTYNLMSFRGLDNPTYYSLTADLQNPWDNTGVGGNYNTRNPVAQDLIVDSLAYWKNTLGVDGFRFDLASVLGNRCEHGCFAYDKLDPRTALNRIVTELPPRPISGGPGTDFIAEPWAIGAGTYQVGNFPAGWSEWNGQYRDTLRRDQNRLGQDRITPAELATRLAGSSDLYGDDGRRPSNSINFLVAHDGFTANDLYSCNGKNNGQAWPYGPSDGGSDDNISWDHDGIAADQRKAARTGSALLLMSGGTPMVTAGDESLRSLRCNNNPYNLDSDANWLNYSLNPAQTDFQTFTQRLLTFRKAHPALRPANFYATGDTNGNAMEQHRWFTASGTVPDSQYWNNPDNHALAWRIDGTEFADPAAALYVAYNGWSGPVDFNLPWPGSGKSWYRVTDTSTWAEGPAQIANPGSEPLIGGEAAHYRLDGRAVLILIAK